MRKFKTFIAFLILVLIVFLLASCVSTEKLLTTKSKNDVVDIEMRRFERMQQPGRPKEWKMWSLCSVAAFIILSEQTKDK